MSIKRHIFSAALVAVLSFGATSADARVRNGDSVHDTRRAVKHDSKKQYAKRSFRQDALRSSSRASVRWSVQHEAQRSISPAEAKSIARKRVPGGEVVDISRRGDTYRVRVIAKSGKVIDVLIDANSGRVKK